jgi:uncharacterized protein
MAAAIEAIENSRCARVISYWRTFIDRKHTGMATLDDIRRYAAHRLGAPTTLERAITTLGFVQADPIRAPARAQDLTLRHRVADYRAGDLERFYATLPIEEDVFINYGFVSRRVSALMHPRDGAGLLPTASNKRARAVLDFIRERGSVHPRDVDAHFDHGTVINYWGGSSSATTHLLENMHYRGWLRVVRREAGIRIYGPQQHAPAPRGAAERRAIIDELVDVVVRKYAPLPAASLGFVIRRIRYGVPQWAQDITAAQSRARQRLARAEIGGETWYWPAGEQIDTSEPADDVRLLAPFDPIVWDRRKFEALWGWPYRFEAYTPVKKRKLGYYALPLLWRERVIGWANVSMREGRMDVTTGYVSGRAPRDRGFKSALDREFNDMRAFLAQA